MSFRSEQQNWRELEAQRKRDERIDSMSPRDRFYQSAYPGARLAIKGDRKRILEIVEWADDEVHVKRVNFRSNSQSECFRLSKSDFLAMTFRTPTL